MRIFPLQRHIKLAQLSWLSSEDLPIHPLQFDRSRGPHTFSVTPAPSDGGADRLPTFGHRFALGERNSW